MAHNAPQAYPLAWPHGWPRSRYRIVAPFFKGAGDSKKQLTIDQARISLSHELALLPARSIVISTNLKLRLDGFPYSGQRNPDDQGVAVYFTRKGKQQVIACDTYTRIADNIRAIAKTVEAMRGIERWGCSELLDRAFTGFDALPPPIITPQKRAWWEVLGVQPDADAKVVGARYRELARKEHPDLRGGDGSRMAEINRAFDEWEAQQ